MSFLRYIGIGGYKMIAYEPFNDLLTVKSLEDQTTVKTGLLFGVAIYISLIVLSGSAAAVAWCADSTLHISEPLGITGQKFFGFWLYAFVTIVFLTPSILILMVFRSSPAQPTQHKNMDWN